MSDSVGQYLNEIGLVPLLTADEERELSKVIEAGQRAKKELCAGNRSREVVQAIEAAAVAKDRFIRANLRLVVSVARRYPLPPSMELLDLIQEGNLGPSAPVDKFDWRKGFKLDLRHVLDPPGHRPGPRPEGLPGAAAGRPFGVAAGGAAPGLR
ncbi:MAG: sigma-70 factor domain-containing protein [Acidimicrobiales bacterium]